MARAGTVAVLLPGAYYFLRETQLPPSGCAARSRRAHGHRDRLQSGHLADDLAADGDEHGVHAVRLTPQEALAGVTINAAHALGSATWTGSLEVGKHADLALWRIERPADLAYSIGLNPCVAVVHGGRVRHRPVAVA